MNDFTVIAVPARSCQPGGRLCNSILFLCAGQLVLQALHERVNGVPAGKTDKLSQVHQLRHAVKNHVAANLFLYVSSSAFGNLQCYFPKDDKLHSFLSASRLT